MPSTKYSHSRAGPADRKVGNKRKNTSNSGAPAAKKARGKKADSPPPPPSSETESDPSSSSSSKYEEDDDDDVAASRPVYVVSSVQMGDVFTADGNDDGTHYLSHRKEKDECVVTRVHPQAANHHYIGTDGIKAAVVFLRLVTYLTLGVQNWCITRVSKGVSYATTPDQLLRAIDRTLAISAKDPSPNTGWEVMGDGEQNIIAEVRRILQHVLPTSAGVCQAGIIDSACREVTHLVFENTLGEEANITLNVK
jgi:hypothetical protein